MHAKVAVKYHAIIDNIYLRNRVYIIYDAMQATATVELGTMYNYKALIFTDSEDKVILDWHGEDTFQQSLHGGSQPCYYLGRGHIGEWVYFNRSNTSGLVDSFTIPGMAYGVVYQRMQ